MTSNDRFSAIPAERQKQIYDYVISNGSAQIKELAEKYSVSEATIRRDLDEVVRFGQIQRTHGGAVAYSNNNAFERAHSEKMALMTDEKQRIGAYAASLVMDGDTVIIDSGTTSYAMLQFLAERQRLTVITNDLPIANHSALDPTSNMIVVPGYRIARTNVLVGYYAEEFLSHIKANKFFMTADALDCEMGVTNANIMEVGIKRAMAAAAQEVILITDSSKFGKQAAFGVYPANRIDTVVTDSGITDEQLKRFKKVCDIVAV